MAQYMGVYRINENMKNFLEKVIKDYKIIGVAYKGGYVMEFLLEDKVEVKIPENK